MYLISQAKRWNKRTFKNNKRIIKIKSSFVKAGKQNCLFLRNSWNPGFIFDRSTPPIPCSLPTEAALYISNCQHRGRTKWTLQTKSVSSRIFCCNRCIHFAHWSKIHGEVVLSGIFFFKGVSNQTNDSLLRGSCLINALATDLALNGLRMQSHYQPSRPH